MPDPRYIHSDVAPRFVPVLTAQAVGSGDLVGTSSGNVVRAEDTAWDTNLATTQTAFAAAFLGVSAQHKPASTARITGNGRDNVIRVDTAGVFEFDCASANFAIGDYVGPAKQTGNLLESKKVVAVGGEALAIGKVVEAGTALTRVKVQILSKVLPQARQS